MSSDTQNSSSLLLGPDWYISLVTARFILLSLHRRGGCDIQTPPPFTECIGTTYSLCIACSSTFVCLVHHIWLRFFFSHRLFPSVSGFVLLASLLHVVFPFFFLILEESLQPLELDYFYDDCHCWTTLRQREAEARRCGLGAGSETQHGGRD